MTTEQLERGKKIQEDIEKLKKAIGISPIFDMWATRIPYDDSIKNSILKRIESLEKEFELL